MMPTASQILTKSFLLKQNYAGIKLWYLYGNLCDTQSTVR